MIIFVSEGQLGNQIFQYMFLKTIQRNNEKIIVFGFDELFNVFDIEDKTILNIPIKSDKKIVKVLKYRLVYKFIRPFLYMISRLKIANCIEVKYEKVFKGYRRESSEYEFFKGFLKNITIVKTGFFQSEKFFDKSLVKNLKIKDKYLKEAEKFLYPIRDKYKVFVHIRRGDYKNFKVFGEDVLLPMSYFRNLIKWFLENRKNCFFIFLSDEPDFVEREFVYLENKIISRNTYEVDFAIMTLCNAGILSPSSFGWWGSYLMRERDVVFAPKYWMGWKSREYYHKDSVASFMTEVDVNSIIKGELK